MAYLIAFIFLPRLWSVSRVHNYITPADFIRGRYGSRGLALGAAVTGILATLPYVALQLVGIQAVLTVMGVSADSTNTYVKDTPLFIAFVVLAVYTYVSAARARRDRLREGHAHLRVGDRGDLLHPGQARRLGPHLRSGAGALHVHQPRHQEAQRHLHPHDEEDRLAPSSTSPRWPWGRRSPCSSTRTSSRRRWRPSAAPPSSATCSLLPAYGVLLGLIALFGYMAIADPATAASVKKAGNAQLAVPFLFQHNFPSWFAGVAFAGDRHRRAGARSRSCRSGRRTCSPATSSRSSSSRTPAPRLQTRVAQWASLVVKLGALYFAVELPHTFSINLQLLGGVWIPADAPDAGLRPVHALVPPLGRCFPAGWPGWRSARSRPTRHPTSDRPSHWAASSDIVFGFSLYIGITALWS